MANFPFTRSVTHYKNSFSFACGLIIRPFLWLPILLLWNLFLNPSEVHHLIICPACPRLQLVASFQCMWLRPCPSPTHSSMKHEYGYEPNDRPTGVMGFTRKDFEIHSNPTNSCCPSTRGTNKPRSSYECSCACRIYLNGCSRVQTHKPPSQQEKFIQRRCGIQTCNNSISNSINNSINNCMRGLSM